MLVRDESSQARYAAADGQLSHIDKVNQWCLEQLAAARIVQDWNNSPANILRQWGQAMHANAVEAKLTRLCPNLVFIIPAPKWSDEKACMVEPRKREMHQRMPDGSLRFLGLYENGFMPEYSIFNVREEWVPDLSQTKRRMVPGIGVVEMPHIERSEVVRTGGHAGMKKIQQPWNEAHRGWRTLLAKLVAAGLTTPVAAEREFGISDRPSWAKHMGKQPDAPSFV